MAQIALTKGERYSFARQGSTTILTDSTDSAEATKLFNNNLTLSGSDTRTLKIDTSNSAMDALVHFKSSTINFSAGVEGSGNTFTVSRGSSLTNAGSISTALRIPDVSSPKVHFDHGIIVTGSAQISNNAVDTTTYSYIMTTVATASNHTTTWSIPSDTTDRMFYVLSEPQYNGANLSGTTSPYLQITTEFDSGGYIAFHETNEKPQYNHSFLIPAGIACTVSFTKGATTKSSSGNLEWKGKSIKLGG